MIRITAFILCLLLVHCSSSDKTTVTPARDQHFSLSGDLAGSQILIAWKGASGSAADLERTRDQALVKARQLASALSEDPSLFDRLAREESDAAEAVRGGRLGSWKTGALTPELNQAFSDLNIGQINFEPVASEFGWHLLRRDPICVPHFGFEAFYIAYAGSEETPATIKRSRDEAQKIADKIAARLSPNSFEKLAHKYNDFADGPMPLEVFSPLEQAPPQLMEAFSQMDFGAVMGPVALPVGFGFFRRVDLQKRAGTHILISFMEARSAGPKTTRTRVEAKELIDDLLAQIEEDPGQFQQLAKQNSDAPDAKKGGVLEPWYRGQMEPEFEAAIDKMSLGQVTIAPVETRYGYHLIRRDPAENPCNETTPNPHE